MTAWTIDLPSGQPPLNLNQRRHWSHRHRETRRLRADAALCIRAAGVPALHKAHLVLIVTPPNNNRRDTDNLVAQLKPIKDALVDAGVVPDDTPEYVSWEPPVLARTDGSKTWRYRLVVRSVDPAEKILAENESHPDNYGQCRTHVRAADGSGGGA